MRVRQPLHDVCIIRPHREVLSRGGIMIPRNAEEFHEDVGEIVYCGPGQMSDEGKLLPMFVKPGDKVLFSTHGHQVTKLDGEELIVLRQNSIICVLEDDRILKAANG